MVSLLPSAAIVLLALIAVGTTTAQTPPPPATTTTSTTVRRLADLIFSSFAQDADSKTEYLRVMAEVINASTWRVAWEQDATGDIGFPFGDNVRVRVVVIGDDAAMATAYRDQLVARAGGEDGLGTDVQLAARNILSADPVDSLAVYSYRVKTAWDLLYLGSIIGVGVAYFLHAAYVAMRFVQSSRVLKREAEAELAAEAEAARETEAAAAAEGITANGMGAKLPAAGDGKNMMRTFDDDEEDEAEDAAVDALVLQMSRTMGSLPPPDAGHALSMPVTRMTTGAAPPLPAGENRALAAYLATMQLPPDEEEAAMAVL
jgi:hypothetical protein